jgi:hypothetical protein
MYLYVIGLAVTIFFFIFMEKAWPVYKAWKTDQQGMQKYRKEYGELAEAELMPHVRVFSKLIEPYGFLVQRYEVHIESFGIDQHGNCSCTARKKLFLRMRISVVLETHQFLPRHETMEYPRDESIVKQNVDMVIGKAKEYFGPAVELHKSRDAREYIFLVRDTQLGGKIEERLGQDYREQRNILSMGHTSAKLFADNEKNKLIRPWKRLQNTDEESI